MYFSVLISICVVTLIFIVQIFNSTWLLRFKKWIWWGSVLAVFLFAVISAQGQYRIWAGNEFTRVFVPPYNTSYFALYSLHHFFGQWIVAFFAGILGGYSAYRLNKRFGERFFEEEEPWLFAIGILFSGFPGLLLYILLVFHVGILLTIVYTLLKKGRAPLYWLWLPLAILAILIVNWYVPREVLVLFNL